MSVKALPNPLVAHLLHFNTREERDSFRKTCHLFSGYSCLSRVDLSIKSAVRQLFGKQPDKPMSFVYHFPDKSHIALRSGKWVDVSHVELNLSEICSDLNAQIIAQSMRVIGDKGTICNLPICIEVNRIAPYTVEDRIVTLDGEEIGTRKFAKILREKLDRNFSIMHFVVRNFEKAFLVSMRVTNDEAVLTIFDSEGASYTDEYTKDFVDNMEMQLPVFLRLLDRKPPFRHLVLQGASHLNGYCILYTALLLTHNDRGLLELHRNHTIFNDAQTLCADLVVRSLLDCWLVEGEKDWEKHLADHFSEENLNGYAHGMLDGVFIKVPKQFRKLLAQLEKRV